VHLKADRLVKKFGWKTVLDELSWEVEPGQIVALLGPNGAGKTTLLEALSGALVLNSGQIFLDGQPYTAERGDLRRRIAYIPDLPPIPGYWTPLRFIGTLLKLYQTPGDHHEDRVVEILERLDLLGVARWRFAQLSRGQSYKAILAGFLASDPELWLVDEPFSSGMDPRGLHCFKDYAREAIKRGRTIIFSTQIVEVAEQIAQRVGILEQGKIKTCSDMASLRANPTFGDLVSQLHDSPRQ
jgi:ABC-type multidrug transport system ATPase subunit